MSMEHKNEYPAS